MNTPPRVGIGSLLACLGAANVAVWMWAILSLYDQPALLGTAALAYSFGVRHAFDADHLAAIDNVTQALVYKGRPAHTVGFHFALGHSMVVFIGCLAIAFLAARVSWPVAQVRAIGATVSAVVSTVFLLALGGANLFLIRSLYASLKAKTRSPESAVPAGEGVGGYGARFLSPLFGRIRHPWQMAPLGMLFGIGFETATEVSLLGASALHGASGMGFASLLLYPSLFAVGMLTLDSADGWLMMRVYRMRDRKGVSLQLHYRMALAVFSTAIALLIGAIGLAGLLRAEMDVNAVVLDAVDFLHAYYGWFGLVIVGVFAATTLSFALAGRWRSARGIADPA